MKVYEAHRLSSGWRDQRKVEWFANPHKAMDALTEDAGCYVEWKGYEHHWMGLTSSNHKDDFYVVYIRDVIE